ncbi:glycosyltransferase [Profundibacterium mesophilum]|uniref:Glycoprotein 3-alpha-L-fucosyltransferase n=1 Tax=Profundibacterium mesophilum KAUST100406-0324 TaxID=1037889 RepID=A0A921TE17_9RHOB|nr:glycosyltransferase [Profundibacterium mesophilum]KAF0676906.1 glycoprotein 3-alpha-L-fucosyltransferase [Profundibacterium mesophilum KAUST100406-0324]
MTIRVGILHPSHYVAGNSRWIDDFVDPDAGYVFEKVKRGARGDDWHKRGSTTTLGEWRSHFRQSYEGMSRDYDVVVANFPPLIFACCLWKLLLRRRTRVVGWTFNFGPASRSRLAPAAGRVLRAAARLVTHSRSEIPYYAKAFGLSEEKLLFVPLQQGDINAAPVPEAGSGYVIAMGSAGRDYGLLMRAVRDLGRKVIVIAKPALLEGLDIPSNVELRSGLTLAECRDLAAGASVMAVPLDASAEASGQVTFLAAMALNVPIVATAGAGTQDYLEDGVSAVLVPADDADAFAKALARLLDDDEMRTALAGRAHRRWMEQYSDAAAGRNLVQVLDGVTGRHEAPSPVH